MKETKQAPATPEARAAMHEMMAAFEAFKGANDARLDEIEKKASADALLEEKVARIDQAVAGAQARLDRMTSEARRPALVGTAVPVTPPEMKAAWDGYLKTGQAPRGDWGLELKAGLSSASNSAGHVVPPETERAIERRLMAASLEALKEPAERAAASIEEVFGRAGDSLARSLTRAAADGELSLAELARAVLNAVNAAAGVKGGGLSAAIAQAVGGLFGGARADGGPVTGGGAYLVGERGPEVFRPSGAGVIEAAGGPGVTVNVRIDGGAPGLMRSEAQIAQSLARAVALGARRM